MHSATIHTELLGAAPQQLSDRPCTMILVASRFIRASLNRRIMSDIEKNNIIWYNKIGTYTHVSACMTLNWWKNYLEEKKKLLSFESTLQDVRGNFLFYLGDGMAKLNAITFYRTKADAIERNIHNGSSSSIIGNSAGAAEFYQRHWQHSPLPCGRDDCMRSRERATRALTVAIQSITITFSFGVAFCRFIEFAENEKKIRLPSVQIFSLCVSLLHLYVYLLVYWMPLLWMLVWWWLDI